jgi:hypothetical protein
MQKSASRPLNCVSILLQEYWEMFRAPSRDDCVAAGTTIVGCGRDRLGACFRHVTQERSRFGPRDAPAGSCFHRPPSLHLAEQDQDV